MGIFKEAFEEYKSQSNLFGHPHSGRFIQLTEITEVLEENFPFDTINCVETGASQSWIDGMVGYYFAYLSNQTTGKFTSVDINPELELKVYEAYNSIDPSIKITHYTDDSVNYLKNIDFIPNLVHLDSWDLNMRDPFPCALHGWREFEAIESKMPVGSIIIIDDNYLGGTWMEWQTLITTTGEVLETENIDIVYPIIGKGAHVYQWALNESTNWKNLSITRPGNVKVIIQKTS
jgi:hypothetical protein